MIINKTQEDRGNLQRLLLKKENHENVSDLIWIYP